MTLRTTLLLLAALRGALGLVAIPLAPALFDDHFVWLVLLRPTKEVLLAAGFLAREGEVDLAAVLPFTIPLSLFGVWLFYALGRQWQELPEWSHRVLPPERVKSLCDVLNRRGVGVILFGRLAAFPSTLLAAAAGASGMAPKKFLVADGAGFVLSVAEVVGAGYAFGAAYKKAGPWLTGVGVVVLLGLLFAVGRWLKSPSDVAARTA